MKYALLLKILEWVLASGAFEDIKDDFYQFLRDKAADSANSLDDKAVEIIIMVVDEVLDGLDGGE